HDRLLQVAMFIEENYGQEFITPKIHLSLHITDCCEDYGPLYSFWCYSFERMNGLLGNKLFYYFYVYAKIYPIGLKIFPIVSCRFLPKQRKEYRARIIAYNPAKLLYMKLKLNSQGRNGRVLDPQGSK